jgi:hypothetical protein
MLYEIVQAGEGAHGVSFLRDFLAGRDGWVAMAVLLTRPPSGWAPPARIPKASAAAHYMICVGHALQGRHT